MCAVCMLLVMYAIRVSLCVVCVSHVCVQVSDHISDICVLACVCMCVWCVCVSAYL